MEPDRPQHDCPSACVIAQQYSSVTVVSMRFPSQKKKFDALQKCCYSIFCTFFKSPLIAFVRDCMYEMYENLVSLHNTFTPHPVHFFLWCPKPKLFFCKFVLQSVECSKINLYIRAIYLHTCIKWLDRCLWNESVTELFYFIIYYLCTRLIS